MYHDRILNCSVIFSYDSENEASMIEEIVEGISSQLFLMQPIDFSDLVGMDDHMERLKPLLRIESGEWEALAKPPSPGVSLTGFQGYFQLLVSLKTFPRFVESMASRIYGESFFQPCSVSLRARA